MPDGIDDLAAQRPRDSAQAEVSISARARQWPVAGGAARDGQLATHRSRQKRFQPGLLAGMKNIETTIDIDAPPSRVWEVLMDFQSYPEWNPFIVSVSGVARAGDKLTVRIQPPGRSGMTFRPMVLVAEPEREFRWRGKVLVRGLFDGDHYFGLEPARRGTHFHQGERFTGLLVPLLGGTLTAAEVGFKAMNERLKARAESSPPV